MLRKSRRSKILNILIIAVMLLFSSSNIPVLADQGEQMKETLKISDEPDIFEDILLENQKAIKYKTDRFIIKYKEQSRTKGKKEINSKLQETFMR